jgi:hypothetical protein
MNVAEEIKLSGSLQVVEPWKWNAYLMQEQLKRGEMPNIPRPALDQYHMTSTERPPEVPPEVARRMQNPFVGGGRQAPPAEGLAPGELERLQSAVGADPSPSAADLQAMTQAAQDAALRGVPVVAPSAMTESAPVPPPAVQPQDGSGELVEAPQAALQAARAARKASK